MPRPFALVLLLLAGGCGGQPSSGPVPSAPPDFVALPDTLVCVVDRAAPRGLRELPAKKQGEEVVVFSGGAVVPLETLHPTNVIAGYAGEEAWLRRGDSIRYQGADYSNVGGERRVGIELLARAGEHQGILLFAGEEDPPPPDALYVPTAPGCVFQPFVREDLIRR